MSTTSGVGVGAGSEIRLAASGGSLYAGAISPMGLIGSVARYAQVTTGASGIGVGSWTTVGMGVGLAGLGMAIGSQPLLVFYDGGSLMPSLEYTIGTQLYTPGLAISALTSTTGTVPFGAAAGRRHYLIGYVDSNNDDCAAIVDPALPNPLGPCIRIGPGQPGIHPQLAFSPTAVSSALSGEIFGVGWVNSTNQANFALLACPP
jgi:hypothetical protein